MTDYFTQKKKKWGFLRKSWIRNELIHNTNIKISVPTIKIIYYPNTGLSINSISLNWRDTRNHVRQVLSNTHQEDDKVTDLHKYVDDGLGHIIIRKRDIYKNYLGGDNYFFLNYNEDDLLNEVEIHHGFAIGIEDITIDFDMHIIDAVTTLRKIGIGNQTDERGEYLFPDLKLLIMGSEAMGGHGNNLSYFYCGENIDHLLVP